MRIHDINLVCDLNEQNPLSSIPPPTQDPPPGTSQQTNDYDGTPAGIALSASIQAIIDWTMNVASDYFQIGWVPEWWPKIFMKILSTSGSVLLHINVDLLGDLGVVSSVIVDHLFNMMGLEQAINWFEAWASASIFPEALGTFNIALAAWAVADGLKLVPASPWIAAAGVALGLSAIFYGIVISYLMAGFAAGFDAEWGRNICISVFMAVFVGIFRFEMDDKLSQWGQSIVTRILVWRGRTIPSAGSWNPTLSTMSNIFKWSTLALFLVLVFVFEGLILGW